MGKTKPIFAKKKSKFSFFRLILVILLVLFFGGISYIVVMARLGTPALPDPSGITVGGIRIKDFGKPGELVFKHKDELVILCVGLDENRDHKGIAHHKGSRTDTIFLLKIDKNADRLGILSIPRDTLVHINDRYGTGKINSAYSLAFLDEYEENGHNYEKAKAAGVKQVRETVEKFLEVPIDYYVLIKIKSAKEMVDAIDGISVDVEKDMDYDDNWGNLHIHLKKGRQKLDGQQAVGYARFRHDEEGDWGRIRRQQQVIKALVKELKKPDNVMKIHKLADVIKKNVETDIPFLELIDMANVYKGFEKDNMTRGVIIGNDVDWGGAASLEPIVEEKARLRNRILKDPGDLTIKDLRVRVYNGCGVHGLAHKVADMLREKGCEVVDVGNTDEEEELDHTKVIDHYYNKRWTKNIVEILGKEDIKVVKKASGNKELNPDYTIILGKDFIDEEEVKKNSDDTPILPRLEPEPETRTPSSTDSSPLIEGDLNR